MTLELHITSMTLHIYGYGQDFNTHVVVFNSIPVAQCISRVKGSILRKGMDRHLECNISLWIRDIYQNIRTIKGQKYKKKKNNYE